MIPPSGALYGGAGDSRWHECGHGTAFKTKQLNDAVYYLASWTIVPLLYIGLPTVYGAR